MKNKENLEEDFLEYLLRSYYDKENSIGAFVKFEAIQHAVDSFIQHFANEDKVYITNHSTIIRKMFVDGSATNINCGIELGISSKTYYRYKQKYLSIFKNYLFTNINDNFDAMHNYK